MDKKHLRDTFDGIRHRYEDIAGRMNRREVLKAAGYTLGGAAVALSIDRLLGNDSRSTPEHEKSPQLSTGIDISYPQGRAEQLAHLRVDFVIVGVNGGRPTDRNPFLVDQLKLATEITQHADPQKTGMLPIQLYLNTANPADFVAENGLVSLPENGIGVPENPYGECIGTDSQACMYVYGWQRAQESVEHMFFEAALQAGVSTNPADYTWWLDIETYNSWRENPKEGEVPEESNRAVLEGMVAYLQMHGAGVGLYSARSHWNEIVGDTVDERSNLYRLPTWLATGQISEGEAKKILIEETEEPFTPGGRLAIVQRVEGPSVDSLDALDYNYALLPEQH